MKIHSALQFVQGAVSTKDFVPALLHYRIADGTILAFDGRMALSSPIACDLECCPRGAQFGIAIQSCVDDVTDLHLTPAGRLSVRSGAFRAFVDTLAEPYPDIAPEGASVPVPPGFLDALRRLYPFTAEDATRSWAAGVLFDGQSAFATNNIVAVEHWLGTTLAPNGEPVNVPRYAVKELLRIGEEPTAIQVAHASVTFWFDGGRWFRTQLHSTDWPDVRGLLGGLDYSGAVPPDPALFAAVDAVRPFADKLGRVYFHGDAVATVGSRDDDTGAWYSTDAPAAGCYNDKHLLSLRDVAERVDWSNYPKPCPFIGAGIRGAIVGMVR